MLKERNSVVHLKVMKKRLEMQLVVIETLYESFQDLQVNFDSGKPLFEIVIEREDDLEKIELELALLDKWLKTHNPEHNANASVATAVATVPVAGSDTTNTGSAITPLQASQPLMEL